MASINQNFVFVPPPLGKPNPEEPRPETGPDNRSRVTQRGARINTCWYGVFNMLRDRYKAPNTEHLPERKFEKAASQRRKEHAAHQDSLPGLFEQLNQTTIQAFLQQNTKDQVGINQDLLEKLKISSILPGFLSQDKYKNLYDYAIYLKYEKREEIHNRFFTQIGVGDKETLQKIATLDRDFFFHLMKILREGGIKGPLFDCLEREVSIEFYKLNRSQWHPTDHFETLIKELKEHGPLAVGGAFGFPHYQDPPIALKKTIEGRQVYGWTKGAVQKPAETSAHMILLVGAERTKSQDLVYYVDPIDESDPLHPEKQRIFVMSYKKLVSKDHIANSFGVLGVDSPRESGYAIHGNFKSE